MDLPRLPLELAMFRQSTAVLQVDTGAQPASLRFRFADAYQKLARNEHPGPGRAYSVLDDFQQYILRLSERALWRLVNRQYFAGAAMLTDDAVTVWFNNQPFHVVPIALNLVHKALLHAHLGPTYGIRVTNAPLPYRETTRIGQVTLANQLGNLLALNVPYAMAFVFAFFVLTFVRERANRANLLQFVSGAKVLIYWSTAFVFDYVAYLLTAGLLLVVFAAFQVCHVYLSILLRRL